MDEGKIQSREAPNCKPRLLKKDSVNRQFQLVLIGWSEDPYYDPRVGRDLMKLLGRAE